MWAAIPGRSILAMAATAHLGMPRLRRDDQLRPRHPPPPAYLNGPQFPAALCELADAEALDLAAPVRPGPGLDADERRAPDWEDYDERMGFIFSFLRAYRQDRAVFDLPPGTPDA